MDWVSRMDQLMTATRDLAKIVAGFHQALKEQGVPPEEAAIISGQYVIAFMGKPREEE